MTKQNPGKGFAALGRRLLGAAAALVLCALPFAKASIAYADNGLQTTLVKGPTVTATAGQTVSSTATCPQQDQVVTGGSFDDDTISGPTAVNGGLVATQTQTSPNTWTVTFTSDPGGVTETVTAVAVCSSSQLQTTLVKGPVTMYSSGSASSTAKCSDAQRVTGGNFDETITSLGALPLSFTHSRPSPNKWTITAGSGGTTGTVAAVAVCSSAPPDQELTTAFAQGPVASFAIGGSASSTATCPREDQVVTGGAFSRSITGSGASPSLNFIQSQSSPNSWTITAVSGSGGLAGTVTAVAVCSSLS
jgi:hypothetical protein